MKRRKGETRKVKKLVKKQFKVVNEVKLGLRQ
jgi:hypothetical protein